MQRHVAGLQPLHLLHQAPKGDKEGRSSTERSSTLARAPTSRAALAEAALGFREWLSNHADKDSGIFAAQLYLEAVNVLGSRAEPRVHLLPTRWARTFINSSSSTAKAKFEANRSKRASHAHPVRHQASQVTEVIELADSQSEKGRPRTRSTILEGCRVIPRVVAWLLRGDVSKGEKPKHCEKADEIV